MSLHMYLSGKQADSGCKSGETLLEQAGKQSPKHKLAKVKTLGKQMDQRQGYVRVKVQTNHPIINQVRKNLEQKAWQ